MAEQNVAIIGKIPGYGQILDYKNTFGKILLRDVTYIDLIPATYTVNLGMIGKNGNISDFYKYTSGSGATTIIDIYKNVIKNLSDYSIKQFEKGLDGIPDIKDDDKKAMVVTAKKICSVWEKTTSIRIMGANDSTFTETISNNFQDNNSGSNLPNVGSMVMNKILPSVNNMLGSETLIGKFQNMGYSNALDALTAASTKSGLTSLLSGRVLGVQFATPNTWQSSSYNSTLNIFIKLASPSGDPVSIYKNITLPILTMMSAGSPITINGVTYAMPLVWDVRAYGITHFKIGAIAAMTISRGSYETVFNSAKQPLLVDVRLTIVPLMQDFAVQYTGSAKGVFDTTITEIKTVIVKASDTAKSLTNAFNSLTASIQSTYNYLKDLMNSIANATKDVIDSVSYGKLTSMYGRNGLGVQSPGDEVDGLMGIAYGGPGDTATQGSFMKVDTYPNDDNGYVAGFANSYTFKV